MCLWRVVIGSFDHACEQRRLSEVEFGELFAKPNLCRLFEAIDFSDAATPQKDAFSVQLQNLLLAEPLFKRPGHHHFGDLPFPGAVACQEMIPDELLRDGRSAFTNFACA